MPHTLDRVDTGDEPLTELGVLVGFDDDLADEATRTNNRIRGLLSSSTQLSNAPRGPGSHILRFWRSCPGAAAPAGIRAASKRNRKLTTIATKQEVALWLPVDGTRRGRISG